MHSGWMDGMGGGYMGLGWLLIVIVVVLVVWIFMRGPGMPQSGQRQQRTALEVLEERYARGEIGREEFEQKKRDLQS